MNYSYEFTASFKRELKQLLKKYKSLKSDILELQKELEANPDLGVHLGGGFRKIRLKITSKNTGKSGGARVVVRDVIITTHDTKIIFVYIWDKSEIESVDIDILRKMITE